MNLKKFFGATVLSLTLLFNSTTQAEEIDGKQALREAMLASAVEDDRVFHQDILFYVPGLQGGMELFGLATNDSFQSSGEFLLWATADDGSASEIDVPFYITQKGKDMKIYYQTNKKWYQYQSPALAATIMDAVATPSNAEIEEMIDQAKEVTILRDTNTQRTMLVKIDSDKLADSMKDDIAANPAESEFQNKILGYIDTGIRKSDVWYTWTVSKVDGRTLTLAVHLSSILQEIARAALDDKGQVWPESIQNILETVAYYSEAKAYTTFLNADAKKKLEIPKNVLKAKKVENLGETSK